MDNLPEMIEKLVIKHWDSAWDLYAKHFPTENMVKETVKMFRPMYVALRLSDLFHKNEITLDEINQILEYKYPINDNIHTIDRRIPGVGC